MPKNTSSVVDTATYALKEHPQYKAVINNKKFSDCFIGSRQLGLIADKITPDLEKNLERSQYAGRLLYPEAMDMKWTRTANMAYIAGCIEGHKGVNVTTPLAIYLTIAEGKYKGTNTKNKVNWTIIELCWLYDNGYTFKAHDESPSYIQCLPPKKEPRRRLRTPDSYSNQEILTIIRDIEQQRMASIQNITSTKKAVSMPEIVTLPSAKSQDQNIAEEKITSTKKAVSMPKIVTLPSSAAKTTPVSQKSNASTAELNERKAQALRNNGLFTKSRNLEQTIQTEAEKSQSKKNILFNCCTIL